MRAHFGLPSVKNGMYNSPLLSHTMSQWYYRAGRRKTGTDYCKVRDSVLHGLGDTSAVLEDCREEWISSTTVGAIYYTEWR